MNRELIRVEPYSTNFEKWGAPVSVAARAGDTIYISGMPPFNPRTGQVETAPFEEQAERVMAQLKHALQTAGSFRSGRVLSTSRSIAWPLPAINHCKNRVTPFGDVRRRRKCA